MKVEKSRWLFVPVSLVKLKRRRSRDDSIVDIADRIDCQAKKEAALGSILLSETGKVREKRNKRYWQEHPAKKAGSRFFNKQEGYIVRG